MRMLLVTVLGTCALLAGGSAMLAAPDQVTQPGQMTQARVWVQNRGKTEAVPIDLRAVNLDAPLKVLAVNAPDATETLRVRLARQAWEYMTLTIPPEVKPAPLVDQQGAAGWETTGIAWTTADGTILLMKRPR